MSLTSKPLPPLDFYNTVAHLRDYAIPVLFKNGDNRRLELLPRRPSSKRLSRRALTEKLARDLQALDIELGRAA